MDASPDVPPAIFTEWLDALEARHLADLRVPEVTRALRALSSAYVARRAKGALDSSGKRAAFALFYAPLHFLTVHAVVRTLAAHDPAPSSVLDVGCGTGAAGAAWAVAAGGAPRVTGVDRHPWAVGEARWTYRTFGLQGVARQGDVGRLPPLRPGGGAIAAYVLNELAEAQRTALLDRLLEGARGGARVLVLEPIARGIAPWWNAAAARVRTHGGRADEWRFPVGLPPPLQRLDRAAGLDHRELTVRSLYCSGGPET